MRRIHTREIEGFEFRQQCGPLHLQKFRGFGFVSGTGRQSLLDNRAFEPAYRLVEVQAYLRNTNRSQSRYFGRTWLLGKRFIDD